MNLKDLIAKMTAIEEGQEIAPTKDDKPSDAEGMISIGGPIPDMMGMGHQEQPKQQDSVSMNVSLNGAGASGVRDLMNILHNIESGVKGSDDNGEEPIMGAAHDAMSHDDNFDEVIDDEEESWSNSASGSSGHHTHGVDAVTFSGDDMNSKGKISPVARAPGTNSLREPSQYDESLVNRLSAMYQEIKEADGKTMSRAAKGNEKYGKDGMQALAKAGREGKSLEPIKAKYNKYDEGLPTQNYPTNPKDFDSGNPADTQRMIAQPHQAVADLQIQLGRIVGSFGERNDPMTAKALTWMDGKCDGRLGPETQAMSKKAYEVINNMEKRNPALAQRMLKDLQSAAAKADVSQGGANWGPK